MDRYWANYDACLDRVAADGQSAQAVLGILKDHFEPSSGDAFFPDGADRTLLGSLDEAGWSGVWVRAAYHWCMRSPAGDELTFVEGDVYLGNVR
ncbi:hypothetical protein EB72_24900 [Mycobacterium sp. SWH-M1]|nr:hypothetical protein EB72_24900 [Mycobacterium sp. SWH-M1]